jgi:hypothetical protein
MEQNRESVLVITTKSADENLSTTIGFDLWLNNRMKEQTDYLYAHGDMTVPTRRNNA